MENSKRKEKKASYEFSLKIIYKTVKKKKINSKIVYTSKVE